MSDITPCTTNSRCAAVKKCQLTKRRRLDQQRLLCLGSINFLFPSQDGRNYSMRDFDRDLQLFCADLAGCLE